MTNTYIEQFDKGIDLYDATLLDENAYLDKDKVKAFIVSLIKQIRTETLMECRGIVEEVEKDALAIGLEPQSAQIISRYLTAINTLIKKETV